MTNNGFQPTNKVQELAYYNRGIKSQAEFERAIGGKPWKIARVTARLWWINGVTEGMRLGFMQTLSDFFGVSLNELVDD